MSEYEKNELERQERFMQMRVDMDFRVDSIKIEDDEVSTVYITFSVHDITFVDVLVQRGAYGFELEYPHGTYGPWYSPFPIITIHSHEKWFAIKEGIEDYCKTSAAIQAHFEDCEKKRQGGPLNPLESS